MKCVKSLKNSEVTGCLRSLCFDKGMQERDIGQFIREMRKSRGYTLIELAEHAGVSLSSVKKLESSSTEVNLLSTTLDTILTAMAMRAPLWPAEIKFLSDAIGRHYDSIERLNDVAAKRLRSSVDAPTSPGRDEPTIEERIHHAVHLLIQAGAGEIVLTQLEALAKLYGERIADEQRTDTRRRFQVLHPERQIDGYTVQDHALCG